MSGGEISLVGKLLSGGRYKVEKKLGAGGMALVYTAWDVSLKTHVVVKAPRAALLEEPGIVERFQQEIRSLVNLTHLHIVRVLDVGQHQGVPYAVMQYLAGGSLEDRRKASAAGRSSVVDPRSLDRWLPMVTKALDYIHGKNYVHRDVKPENILFDEQGNAFLSDFGIAKAFAETRSLTDPGKVLGTVDYMAPEVVMGENYDGRSDQYSLAVMIYELLCGHPPYSGKTPAAVIIKKTTDPAPPLSSVAPHLPRALCSAIDRGLLRDPQRRFSDCGSFAKAVLEGSSAAAPAPQQQGAPPPQKRELACCVCGARLAIALASAGKTVKCPNCHHTLRVLPNLSGLVAADGQQAVVQSGSGRPAFPTPARGATQGGPSQGNMTPTTAHANPHNRPTPMATQPTSRQSFSTTRQNPSAGHKKPMASWNLAAIIAVSAIGLFAVGVIGAFVLVVVLAAFQMSLPDSSVSSGSLTSGDIYIDNLTDKTVEFRITRFYDVNGMEQNTDTYWVFKPQEDAYILDNDLRVRASKIHYTLTTPEGVTSWETDYIDTDGDLYIDITDDHLSSN